MHDEIAKTTTHSPSVTVIEIDGFSVSEIVSGKLRESASGN
jgi:hypothetical protein